MRRWWNRLFVVLILVIARVSIYAVWPDEPDRYLPDVIAACRRAGAFRARLGPLKLPCHSTDDDRARIPRANCKGMTLGLDLQGGSRIDAAGRRRRHGRQPTTTSINGLDAAKEIIENRINPFGVSESQVQRSGKDRLDRRVARRERADGARHHAPGGADVLRGAAAGRPGVAARARPHRRRRRRLDRSYYKPGTCEPDVDANGDVALANADGTIAKNADGTIQRVDAARTPPARQRAPTTSSGRPAKGDLNGAPTIMTGNFLKSNSQVHVRRRSGAPHPHVQHDERRREDLRVADRSGIIGPAAGDVPRWRADPRATTSRSSRRRCRAQITDTGRRPASRSTTRSGCARSSTTAPSRSR